MRDQAGEAENSAEHNVGNGMRGIKRILNGGSSEYRIRRVRKQGSRRNRGKYCRGP